VTAPAAFEIVDLERGGVVYISDDPPDACSGYGEPCGGCDECRWRQAGPSYARRQARPWVAWPGWDACSWCGLGRAGGERCERCGEPAVVTNSWTRSAEPDVVADALFGLHYLGHLRSPRARVVHVCPPGDGEFEEAIS